MAENELNITEDSVFATPEITAADDLRLVIDFLRDEAYSTPSRALKAVNEAEKYLQQAYVGRYLFELIQNVRDANKQAGINGSVFIELTDSMLLISNTGSPFDKKGFKSITTIGDSPKDSRDFIGFKGIGFKSIQEITQTPVILTQYGSVIFDRALSYNVLSAKLKDIKSIPLFFIPHFDSAALSDDMIDKEIVTQIQLPLKAGMSASRVEKSFEGIKNHQLLFLGHISNLEFRFKDKLNFYRINEQSSGRVRLSTHEGDFYFKHYRPTSKITIPFRIIAQLEDKEREMYVKDPTAEISLLFDMTENGQLMPIQQANLYLYYPLDIRSGFLFLIHSYFIVNPERTDLRDIEVNHFLLQQIADYITGEWLRVAMKSHRTRFIDYLAFERNEGRPVMAHLYNRAVENLKGKRFIYDSTTKKFYASSEVIIGDGFDRGLFQDNRINNKQIIYVENARTQKWLREEIGVEYLHYDKIREYIEAECERQRKQENFDFFNNLYRYLVVHDGLNVRGLKVLLTSRRQLMSSDDEVFYGMTKSKKVQLPESIQKKIYFSHPKILISEQRQGKGQTGFLEYNTELLVRRLLNLFGDTSVPNEDILIAILGLPVKERLYPVIRAKVLFPMANGKWINPLQLAVYVPVEELLALYPRENFIDLHDVTPFFPDIKLLYHQLTNFGAWNVPAIYFSRKSTNISPFDDRYAFLRSVRNFSGAYELKGDWHLNVPAETNEWFTDSVINNWNNYIKLMTDEDSPKMSFRAANSNTYELEGGMIAQATSLLQTLRKSPWLHLAGKPSAFKVSEVIGFDPIEFHSSGAASFKKYLHLLKIHFSSNKELILLLGIKHMDLPTIENWKQILNHIAASQERALPEKKEFINFYNKILGKLYEFYEDGLPDKKTVKQLATTNFLSVDEQSGETGWAPASAIFYMDDKPAYNLLPKDIKKLVQPQFTIQDKNRFGQIARQIGLSYKTAIRQELDDESYLTERTVDEFFPFLAECLALAEAYLYLSLHKDLERIKQATVRIKEEVMVNLFRNDKFVQQLLVDHKIVSGKTVLVYSINKPLTNTSVFYARLLNDFLTEFIGKDLERLQNVLADFISRNDKETVLINYDAAENRVEEIREFLQDRLLNDEQLFWKDVLASMGHFDAMTYFYEEQIAYNRLAAILSVDPELLINLASNINYKYINDSTNVPYLKELFQRCGVSITEFNESGTMKIDFYDHYARKFEGIKNKYRTRFESGLYSSLKAKVPARQAEFQDLMDRYNRSLSFSIARPVLFLQVNDWFANALQEAFPLFDTVKIPVKPFNLQEIYETHRIVFFDGVTKSGLQTNYLADFISYNQYRSLIYFGKINELISKYKTWLKTNLPAEPPDGEPASDPLIAYFNLPGTRIEKMDTTQTDTKFNGVGGSSGGGGGKRIDGGDNAPIKELIGIVSEKVVYEALQNDFTQVEWVSKNAAKAKINAEGSDEWGYDIRYVDEHDDTHYVEVKGKMDQHQHFYITRPEINVALAQKTFYHLYFVPDALDNNKRRIKDLGNIFLLEGSDDLFSNSKFTANFKLLEISFN